jgi:RNA 2',3'-cyclic 3'-phosphodiesterase
VNLRLFVAIELPEPLLEGMAEVQQGLKRRLGTDAVRWVDPHSCHLTLKFLGDTDEGKVAGLKEALADACAAAAAMELHLSGLGVFPNARRPRVVWVGLDGSLVGLAELQAQVEKAIGRLGFPPEERAFSPHLTLGRVRDGATTADYGAIAAALSAAPTVPAATLPVREVSLMRSVLRPQGAEYTCLFAAPLPAVAAGAQAGAG